MQRRESAEVVRRDWLRTFLIRKTLPKGGAAFLGRWLATGAYEFTRAAQEGHPLGCEMFGVEHTAGYYNSTPTGLHTLIDSASDARCHVITLGLVLAACEAATDTHSWRNVSQTTAAHLVFLAEHGYGLADVERLACGQEPLPYTQHDTAEAPDLSDADNAHDQDTDDAHAAA